jgi:hypothetical protein
VSVTLTERVSGKVRHSNFDDLAAALDALERRGHELQGQADADAVGGTLMRRYEPSDQVVARLELSVKAGVDVRGDGSAVPFTGKWRRREVLRSEGESAYAALRRTLASG